MKHVDIRYHFIRKRVDAGPGDIELDYIPTSSRVADILTKPLGREKHEHFIEGMGLIDN